MERTYFFVNRNSWQKRERFQIWAVSEKKIVFEWVVIGNGAEEKVAGGSKKLERTGSQKNLRTNAKRKKRRIKRKGIEDKKKKWVK